MDAPVAGWLDGEAAAGYSGINFFSFCFSSEKFFSWIVEIWWDGILTVQHKQKLGG